MPHSKQIQSYLVSGSAALRETALRFITSVSTFCGRRCLTPQETAAFIADQNLRFAPGTPATLKVGGSVSRAEILACGVVRTNGSDCLNLDFGNRSAAVDFSRPSHAVKHAIALWSHPWLGFYHFMAEVCPKVCKAQEVFGNDLGGAKFCYPRIHRKYETELLGLLEVPAACVVDTREVGGVVAENLTIIPMAGWFQPPPNIDLLRKRLSPLAVGSGGKLLFLTRGGRRRCLNEPAILQTLLQLGFEIVDESSRSIPEQIGLFKNARVIVGPHGSAFTNMIWAPPGAEIVELVPSTFDVAYHTALSASCRHRHTKVLCPNGPASKWGVKIDFSAPLADVFAAVDAAVSRADLDPK